MSSLGIKPLIYYFYLDGNWQRRELPVNISKMQVGTNPKLCSIQMDSPNAAEVQVLMKRIGNVWHFIETGKNPMMIVNGIPSRQAQLLPKSSAVIQIASFLFIFSSRSPKILLHKTAGFRDKYRPPKEGEYSLKINDHEVSYPQDSICLVGSMPLCDFHIRTKIQFCGYISSYNEVFYFNSFIANFKVMDSDNELSVTNPVVIESGNTLLLDNFKIQFTTKETTSSEQSVSTPNKNADSLALIQISDTGEILETYELPESGNSIYAGRSKKQSDIVIEGSTKISRKHAQIEVYNNMIHLLDTGAKNGLFINDEKITDVYLVPGNIFRIGDLRFILGYA